MRATSSEVADSSGMRSAAAGSQRDHVAAMTTIRLVAGRELTTRSRSKAFKVMTGIVLLAIVVLVLLSKIIAGMDDGATKVGLVGADSGTSQQLVAAGSALGRDVSVVGVTDESSGRAAIASGDIDALVLDADSADIQVVVNSDLSGTLRNVLVVMAQHNALDAQVRSLGGDPAEVSAAMATAGVSVDVVNPPPDYDVGRLVLGVAAGVLIFMSLMSAGQMLAQGVVEEKSSRVVELLLATARPWELMVGKVAGIGLLALIQVALYGIVGVGLSVGLGTLSLSLGSAVGTVVWMVVWYLVGYVMYAFAFAAAGAMVSRQEDAAGVLMPVMTFLMIGYIVGVAVLPSNPSSSFAAVLSLIPPFAPTLMPIRLAMGGVPVWQAALSLVLALGLIPLLAWLSGRIYRNAVIHLGARVPLKTALGK